MWRVAATTVLMTVFLGAGQPASANEKAVTFKGSCALAGTVSFQPLAALVPRPGTSSAEMTGTCSGTLMRGEATFPVRKASARYAASASSSAMSCGGGTSAGSGRLIIDGTPVGFSLSEIRVGPVAYLTMRGGATMSGIVTVDPAAGLDAVRACSGPGLSTVTVTGQLFSL